MPESTDHGGRSSAASLTVFVCLFFCWGLSPAEVGGQSIRDMDESILHSVYSVDSGAFAGYMRVVNRSSYMAFVLVPAGMWTQAAIANDPRHYGEAYRTTLAAATSGVAMTVLKHTLRRDRPFTTEEGITLRTNRTGVVDKFDPFSFPSGHATLSFSLATSLFLSYPQWYVAVPGYLIATSIGVSRIWHGMHYPSDILAGALLGSAVSVIVWALEEQLTPSRWHESKGDIRTESSRPLLRVRLSF